MKCSEWIEVTFGEIINSISETHARSQCELVLINTSDVSNGKVINHTPQKNINLKGQFKKAFRMDDILYSEIRPKNKRFAYVDFDANNYIASTKLMVLRRKDENVDNLFLFYALSSTKIINELQLVAETRSGTFPQITFDELSGLKLKLPPLQNQKKVSNILSSLDNKIDNNNKINIKLEELAQAIFKRWFIEFEFPNEEGKPYKSSGGEMIETEYGMVPKGWTVKKIGNSIEFVKGKKPQHIENISFESAVLYLTIDVLKNSARLYCKSEKIVTVDELDILMVMDGSGSGRMYFGKTGALGSTLAVLKTKESSREFFYNLLKMYEADLNANTTGSAIPHTDKGYIKDIKYASPIDSFDRILSEFNSLSYNIRTQINKNNMEAVKLREIRDSLLPKLMSGELNVPCDDE